MEQMLTQILNKLDKIESQQSKNTQMLKSLEHKMSENHQSISKLEQGQANLSEKITTLEQGQQSIKELVLNIEAKNAERHIEIMNKLSRDIEFIKHKEFKNEEDIFNLKRNLEIAK